LFDAGALKGSLGVTKLSLNQFRIRKLEQELTIAREERDILKKATQWRTSRNCQNEVRHDRQTQSFRDFCLMLIDIYYSKLFPVKNLNKFE
jgi:hypothetical protein